MVVPFWLISMGLATWSEGEVAKTIVPMDVPGLSKPPDSTTNGPEREPLPTIAPLGRTVKPLVNEWEPLPARVSVAGLTPLPTRDSWPLLTAVLLTDSAPPLDSTKPSWLVKRRMSALIIPAF